MESMSVILLLCVCLPIIPALFLVPDRRSRLFLGFLLIGMLICFMMSEFNIIIVKLLNDDMYYATTNIIPIAEELAKGIAVLYFALFISKERDDIISVAIAVGLGFALLENLIIMVGSIEDVSYTWAVARGLGATQMHAACTAIVGLGISYINDRRVLFFGGTFALLSAASIFHASFNMLVQSEMRYLAFIWAAILFVPLIVVQARKNLSRKKEGAVEG